MTDTNERATILVVDDYAPNLMILGEGLMDDHDVVIATSGQQALDMAASIRRPDLILLDILMPEMDGYEVCRRLKAEAWTQNIPVIFISAKDGVEDETRGLGLGAVDYIAKPFSLPIVKARVRAHVELKRHRDLLENLSMRDGLTGIGNRRSFDRHFDMMWRNAARDRAQMSVIMADIDHFKAYNDHYGHVAGDDCLRKVARALDQRIKRPLDFAARYGGEEFVCVLPTTGQPGAITVAEGIRTAVMELGIPHAASPVAKHVTISLGVATCVPEPNSPNNLILLRADTALYAAKRSSRNTVRYVSGEDGPLTRCESSHRPRPGSF